MSKRRHSDDKLERDQTNKKTRFGPFRDVVQENTDDSSDEQEEEEEEERRHQKQKRIRRQDPGKEEEDLTNMFKKVKLRNHQEEAETTWSDEEDERYLIAQLERRQALDKCLEFFLLKGPGVSKHIVNRKGQVTALLVKNYLGTLLRRVGLVNKTTLPAHVKVSNDMFANCENLRLLYKHFPKIFY